MSCFVTLCCLALAAGPPIEETTRQLIGDLQQTQHANIERYPSGSLRFELTTKSKGVIAPNIAPQSTIAGEVRWSGSNSHTKITPLPGDLSKASLAEVYHPAPRQEYIINDKEHIQYSGKTRVVIDTWVDRVIPPEQHLTPKDYWYQNQMGPDLPCIKLIEAIIKQQDPTVTCQATRSEQSVVLCFKATGGRNQMTATYSLALDGNLTSFSYDSPHGDDHQEGRYQWLRDPQGRTFLDSSEHVGRIVRQGQSMETQQFYKTVQFDPEVKPRIDEFTVRSLQLPQGVVVRDDLKKTRYKIGQIAPKTVADSLKGLADSMRFHGFSTPGR